MNKKCINCQGLIGEEANFCRYCGARQEIIVENKAETHHKKEESRFRSGYKTGYSFIENFCHKCRTLLEGKETIAQSSETPEETEEIKRPKRKKLFSAIALVLVISVFWLAIKPYLFKGTPTNINTGGGSFSNEKPPSSLDGISFTEEELGIRGETIPVSGESPVANIGGVTIDFGEYNLDEEEILEVAKLPYKYNERSGVEAEAYNLSLGNIEEFPALVKVTLPYNPEGLSPEEEEYAISIGYYDKDGDWKILPSEVDTVSKTVTFKTDHFSPFGVLKNKLSKGNKVFYYEDNKYLGVNTPILVDTGALKKALNEISTESFDRLIQEKTVPTNGFLSTGLDLMNNIAAGGDYSISLGTALTVVGSRIACIGSKIGNKFVALGAILVSYKVIDQWCRGVTVYNIIRDNAFSILELVVLGAAIAYSSSILLVCGAGIWIAGLVDSSYRESDNPHEYISDIERIYDAFNREHITYLENENRCTYYLPLPGERKNFHPGERSMSTKKAWSVVVNNIHMANKEYPNLIQPKVNHLLGSYSDVFWNVPRSSILYWIDENNLAPKDKMAKDIEWPDEATIENYKKRNIQRMHDRLHPLYKMMAEKQLADLWTDLYTTTFELAEELNQTMTIEVKDPLLKEPGFAKSIYTSKGLYLMNNGVYKNDFYCKERHLDSDRVFTCNVYHYITADIPSELIILAAGEDIDTALEYEKYQIEGDYPGIEDRISFEADIPLTVIPLAEREVATGTIRLKPFLGGSGMKEEGLYKIVETSIENMGAIAIDGNGNFTGTGSFNFSDPESDLQESSYTGSLTFSGQIDIAAIERAESAKEDVHVGSFRLLGEGQSKEAGYNITDQYGEIAFVEISYFKDYFFDEEGEIDAAISQEGQVYLSLWFEKGKGERITEWTNLYPPPWEHANKKGTERELISDILWPIKFDYQIIK